MTLWRRVLLGAAIGMFAVLLAHPDTRPYYGLCLWGWGHSKVLASTPLIPANLSNLPLPRSADDAAYGFTALCESVKQWSDIARADHHALAEIARAFAKREPENSFWRQIESACEWSQGNRDRSVRAWLAAARASYWNDHQGPRLHRIIEALRLESGTEMSWHYAVAYYLRSTAVANEMVRHANALLASVDPNSYEGLILRYATIMNGQLIREGARSNRIGWLGLTLVNRAVELGGAPASSPRERLLSEYELYNQMKLAGLTTESEQVNRAFQQSESWVALSQVHTSQNQLRQLTMASIVLASICSAMLGCAIVGALIAGIGLVVYRSERIQRFFRVPLAPATGIVIGVLAYSLTELLLLAVALTLCFGFFAFVPPKVRSRAEEPTSSLFHVALAAFAVMFSVVTALFFLGASPTILQLGPELHLPVEYYGVAPLFLSLAAILIGLVLLTAPAWGFLERLSASRVAGIALRNFGRGVMLGCFAVAVVAGPAVVYLDRQLSEELKQIADNEPTYYVVQ